MGSQEMDPNDSLIPAHEFPEYDETLQLLIERISQLPLTTRRILAMYYYETMPIREIAAGLVCLSTGSRKRASRQSICSASIF